MIEGHEGVVQAPHGNVITQRVAFSQALFMCLLVWHFCTLTSPAASSAHKEKPSRRHRLRDRLVGSKPPCSSHRHLWGRAKLREAPANSNITSLSLGPILRKVTKLWRGKVKRLWQSQDIQAGALRSWKSSDIVSAESPRTQQFRALSADHLTPWCPLVKTRVKCVHPEVLAMDEIEKGKQGFVFACISYSRITLHIPALTL